MIYPKKGDIVKADAEPHSGHEMGAIIRIKVILEDIMW